MRRRRGSPASPPSSGRSWLATVPRSSACSGATPSSPWRRLGGSASASATRRRPTRQVAVIGPGGTRGAVIASVPLDRALVSRLEARSGLESSGPRPPGGGRQDRGRASRRSRPLRSPLRQDPDRLPRRNEVPGAGCGHARRTAQRDARRDQPAGAHRRCQPKGDEPAAHRPRRRARLRGCRGLRRRSRDRAARSGVWSTPLPQSHAGT